MEEKLLGRMICLWNRKYMFPWHHWHDTYCHLGVLRKHLACFLTCCSHPFRVATSKCTTNAKMSSNVRLSTLPNVICSRLLQSDQSSPFPAGRAVEAKMPWNQGLGVELEPKFFTQCVLWGHVHRHCCLCVHSSCQLLPVLYRWINPLLLNGSQNHGFTESRNVWGWKGCLEITQSNTPAKAGSLRPGCPGSCPGGFWVSPEKKNAQSLWAAC